MGRRPRILGAVSALMVEHDQHAWTLEEIQTALSAQGVEADYSSVFRVFARLEAEGVVRRLDLDEGRARFELEGPHHDHLRCDHCGALAPVPCGVLDGAMDKVEEHTGFVVTGHRLLVTGICRACRQTSEAALQARSPQA